MGERIDACFLPFDLDKIAVETRRCHWISTPDGDNGHEWCKTCGHYKIRNLRRHDRKRREDYILDGGWRTEHDYQPMCHGCGAYLDGCLTKYGARQGMDHYRSEGLSTRPDIDALYLSEILGSLPEDDEDFPLAVRLAQEILASPRSDPSRREEG